MWCRLMQWMISADFGGAMTARHTAGCRRCAAFRDALGRLERELRSGAATPAGQADARLTANIMDAVRREATRADAPAAPASAPWPGSMLRYGVAAVALAAVAGVGGVVLFSGNDGEPAAPVAQQDARDAGELDTAAVEAELEAMRAMLPGRIDEQLHAMQDEMDQLRADTRIVLLGPIEEYWWPLVADAGLEREWTEH